MIIKIARRNKTDFKRCKRAVRPVGGGPGVGGAAHVRLLHARLAPQAVVDHLGEIAGVGLCVDVWLRRASTHTPFPTPLG